ncbi:MAG: efflux RND transporter periplasmic adaptor subunit [Psychromonas sp.]
MKKGILLSSILTIIIGVTSYSSVSSANTPKKRTAPVVSVYTDTVQYHQVAQSISLIGKLESQEFVDIATEVTGKVVRINVKANQEVKKGQLLFQLDDSQAQAAVLEAEAYLTEEKRKLDEFARLVKNNAVTKTMFDGQAATVDIAQARLNSAKSELDRHYLRAPFAGTIGLIDFSLGKMVSMGSELMTLDNLDVMHLDIQVPDRYLSLLSRGMEVYAYNRAWPGQLFTGKLVAVDSRINHDTLNLRVRVQFDNLDNRLRPGMMMSANMAFEAVNEPIIPVQAIEYSGTKRFVYVINEDNVAKRTEVMLGARIENNVLIEEGVEVGDKIVIQGLVNMRDGLKVKDLADPKASQQVKKESN